MDLDNILIAVIVLGILSFTVVPPMVHRGDMEKWICDLTHLQKKISCEGNWVYEKDFAGVSCSCETPASDAGKSCSHDNQCESGRCILSCGKNLPSCDNWMKDCFAFKNRFDFFCTLGSPHQFGCETSGRCAKYESSFPDYWISPRNGEVTRKASTEMLYGLNPTPIPGCEFYR